MSLNKIDLPDPEKAEVIDQVSEVLMKHFDGRTPADLQRSINKGFLDIKKKWDKALEMKPEMMPLGLYVTIVDRAKEILAIYFMYKTMVEHCGLKIAELDPRITKDFQEVEAEIKAAAEAKKAEKEEKPKESDKEENQKEPEKEDEIDLPDPKKAKLNDHFEEMSKGFFKGDMKAEDAQKEINDGFLILKKGWDELMKDRPSDVDKDDYIMGNKKCKVFLTLYFKTKHMVEKIGLKMAVLDRQISATVVCLKKDATDSMAIPDPEKAEFNGKLTEKFKKFFKGKTAADIQTEINESYAEIKSGWDQLIGFKPDSMSMERFCEDNQVVLSLIKDYATHKHMAEKIGLKIADLDARIGCEVEQA